MDRPLEKNGLAERIDRYGHAHHFETFQPRKHMAAIAQKDYGGEQGATTGAVNIPFKYLLDQQSKNQDYETRHVATFRVFFLSPSLRG
jgi:hypothetical protein